MEANQRASLHAHVPDQSADDAVEALIKCWPGIRSYRQVFMHLWRLNGCQAGTLTVNVESIGELLGPRKDSYRRGTRALKSLGSDEVELLRLELLEGVWGTVHVEDPRKVAKDREAKAGLRKIDPGPQPELKFRDDGEAPVVATQLAPQLAPEVAPEVAEGYLLDGKKTTPNTPNTPSATTGASCGATTGASCGADRLGDPAFVHTLEGLAHLWVANHEVWINGRKRENLKDARKHVAATLRRGFTPEEIAAEMRTQENSMDYYNVFHNRLLKERKDRGGKSKGTSHGDYDPTRTDYPEPGKDAG